MFIALLAHTFVGTRETFSIRPVRTNEADSDNVAALERNWIQALCAFQLVTVDLSALSLLLFALGATEWIPARRQVTLAVSALLMLWGVAWLIQLIALRRPARDYLLLGQWLLCFVCAALLCWGTQSL